MLILLKPRRKCTHFAMNVSDIEVVQKALVQYEKVTGAKINRNKSSGLELDAWRGVALLGSFS